MAISKKEAKLISDSIRSLLVSQDMVDSGNLILFFGWTILMK